MKILLVSYYFPPYNTPGALRNSRTAELLLEFGHDVRVLCAESPTLFGEVVPMDLESDFPRERVCPTEWKDIGRLAQRIRQNASDPKGGAPEIFEAGRDSFWARLYRSLVYLPDERIGWYPHAVAQGRRLLNDWMPDILLASGLPMTAILVGRTLAQESDIPWCAEFRDLFSEGHYYSKLGWRRSLDRLFEGHVLKDASGLVTVSEPWAQILEERHAPPVCVIRNGYDTKDFENLEAPPEQAPGRLQLFYGGSLYGGLRDPKLLFEALELLGEEAASIDINFFVGTACQNVVNGIAERYKFKAKLQALPLIAHKESLKEQQRSDVLLLIEADLDTTEGVLAAKVFEYFAARRRIVILGGRQDSVASKAVLNKQAGAHPLSAAELAETLREWGSLKREGRLGRLPASVSEGFSREEQVRKLEGFLSARLGAH